MIRYLFFLLLLLSCQDKQIVVSNPTIIPKPVKMILNEGFYNWSSNAQIISDSLFVSEKKYFQKLFSIQDIKEKNKIYFKKNNLLLKEEYFLKISENQITIEASSPNGIMHGIQSLRQIIPINENISKKNISINCLEIHDFPRFKWRGLLLDCCRHFMQKDFVKRYIDLLAFHKMNILHWHLTEDQGWRIEIEKYPKLTEIGAWRENKDSKKYGGFYTKKDIKEIVLYAKDRGIEIIPEIEADLQRLEQISRRFSNMGSKSDFEEFDLSERIEKIVSYLAMRLPSLGKKVQLINEIEPGIIINANGSLLAWSIENIIRNGIDSIVQKDGIIKVSLRKELNDIKIRITDNGKGIPKKDWRNIFRPGFSTKQAGWGLGLSLAKRIIEDIHNGDLKILKSSGMEGTVFEINL